MLRNRTPASSQRDERLAPQIIAERRTILFQLRALLGCGAIIGALFLFPAALYGDVALLMFGLLAVMVAGLMGLGLTMPGPEVSGDVIFTSGVPARTILFGGDLGLIRAAEVARAEKVFHGDWLVVRVVSRSGEMVKFHGKADDARIEAVLEWLQRRGLTVEQRRVGVRARAPDQGRANP